MLAAARKYKVESRLSWDGTRMRARAIFLDGKPSEVVLAGECPRCHHGTQFAWPLIVLRDHAAAPDLVESARPGVAPQAIDFEDDEEAPAEFTAEATYDIRVECRCNNAHTDDASNTNDSCGAYWYKRVERDGERVRVRVGERAYAPSTADAADLEASSADQVDQIRKLAENWRTGLAGLMGLVTIVAGLGLLTGANAITDLEADFKIAVAICVLLALLVGAVGLILTLRAAHGWPSDHEAIYPSRWTRLIQRAKSAKRQLFWGIACSVATFVLVIAALGLTLFAPKDPPAFLSVDYVTLGGEAAKVCGETKTGPRGLIVIESPEDEDDLTRIGVGRTKAVKVVESC